VFDWGWANGAHRAGIRYYPKLVAAVPFTPVTGARLLVHAEADRAEVTGTLLAGVHAVAEQERASSVHVLFCSEAETRALEAAGYLPRLGMQFHWENRDPPYRDFDDYLGEMRSRNRKQVRKERAGAAEGLRLVTLTGPELGDAEWTALRRFYLANARKHGGAPYLTAGFFELARETFPERVVAALAYRGERPIAGTLNFERGRHLYGRYWGCLEEHEFLHFELGYYRLIERAIAAGHTRFEAGAQGEHKLKRGLLPRPTYSAHLMLHPDLHRAVERFVRDETMVVREEMTAYDAASPFRRDGKDAG
jgi:predicted N-acyltransferase